MGLRAKRNIKAQIGGSNFGMPHDFQSAQLKAWYLHHLIHLGIVMDSSFWFDTINLGWSIVRI